MNHHCCCQNCYVCGIPDDPRWSQMILGLREDMTMRSRVGTPASQWVLGRSMDLSHFGLLWKWGYMGIPPKLPCSQWKLMMGACLIFRQSFGDDWWLDQNPSAPEDGAIVPIYSWYSWLLLWSFAQAETVKVYGLRVLWLFESARRWVI